MIAYRGEMEMFQKIILTKFVEVANGGWMMMFLSFGGLSITQTALLVCAGREEIRVG